MQLISIFVYFCIALYQIDVICQYATLQSEFRITKMLDCNITGLIWRLQNVSIFYQYPRTTINAIFNVTEEIKYFSSMNLHIDRCDDQGIKCEDFQSWRIKNFCSMLTWKNQIWSSFVDSIHPPFHCPIKKMVFSLKNATFDMNSAFKWYPDLAKYQWKGKCKIFGERNQLVYCADLALHVYQYKKKNKEPPK